MKAVIIGCNGYLGKHLCAFLMKKEWFISGYDTAQNPLITISKYQAIDITQKDQLNKIDLDLDYLFYFSGITGTINAYDKYENYIDINEKGLLHLLDLIRHSKSKIRFIFPSTRLVYKGVVGQELDENSEKEFKTIYALNKWFGEQVIQQYANYYDLKYNIFRIGIPYANRFTKEYSYGTVGFFLSKANSNESIVLYGTGDQRRTFTHVDDICMQIYYSIKKPESVNRIFNISGETFSLSDIALKIAVKYNVKIVHKEWPKIDEKLESGDTIFNSNQIQELIKKPLNNSFNNWLNNL